MPIVFSRSRSVKSLFSIYLRVLAVVTYVQYIASQFYDPAGEGVADTVYRILDPLLVLGMISWFSTPTNANNQLMSLLKKP